jgi:hypothetical protein
MVNMTHFCSFTLLLHAAAAAVVVAVAAVVVVPCFSKKVRLQIFPPKQKGNAIRLSPIPCPNPSNQDQGFISRDHHFSQSDDVIVPVQRR